MIQTWKVFVLLPLFASAASVCLAQKPHVYRLSGDVAGTHDPSIMKEGKTWYVFATGKVPGGGQFAVRCSDDLEHWKLCGHVFDVTPAWILERSQGTKDL
jgi:arabinan endo-1,5-alpha-L-arabinosidase